MMSGVDGSQDVDYRFSLANERTFLAWIRTSLALVAGGVVAAKALEFHHEVWRWVVAGPPVAAGAVLAADAVRRWRLYEDAMRSGRRLPVGRGISAVGVTLCVYALVVLAAVAFDGG
jgi:putative membrane protein